MNNQIIWEEVKANIEGHLDVNVDKVRSKNGIDVQIVMIHVPSEWLPECVSGAESILACVLIEHHQVQIPACVDISVLPIDGDPEDCTLAMTFMLIVKPADPTFN